MQLPGLVDHQQTVNHFKTDYSNDTYLFLFTTTWLQGGLPKHEHGYRMQQFTRYDLNGQSDTATN